MLAAFIALYLSSVSGGWVKDGYLAQKLEALSCLFTINLPQARLVYQAFYHRSRPVKVRNFGDWMRDRTKSQIEILMYIEFLQKGCMR